MANNGKSRKYEKKNNFQPNSEAKIKMKDNCLIDFIMKNKKLKGLRFGEKADKSPDTSVGDLYHFLALKPEHKGILGVFCLIEREH